MKLGSQGGGLLHATDTDRTRNGCGVVIAISPEEANNLPIHQDQDLQVCITESVQSQLRFGSVSAGPSRLVYLPMPPQFDFTQGNEVPDKLMLTCVWELVISTPNSRGTHWLS